MKVDKLSPAQAMLVVDPRASTGPRCLQAGLLVLLGTGRISARARQSLLQDTTLVLRDGPYDTDIDPHIRAIDDALRIYGRGTVLSRSQVLHALQKAFGLGFGNYVHDHVGPSLIERGLLTCERRKMLGLFPVRRYSLTPSGEALAPPLRRLREDLEGMRALIKQDPERALQLARSAGVLIPISPRARRELPALRKLLEVRAGDGDTTAAYHVEATIAPRLTSPTLR